ncbi:MAG: hypothetical protein RL095_3042 [Verrucomicrobiota bacterium]|jgi:DNA-binding transcriptional LysR family regulator
MNLNLLRILHAVAGEGGVSNAATKLEISQPAVSQALNRLEKELGISLFDRYKGRLLLSAAGQQIALLADELFLQEERIEERVAQLRSQQGLVLRLLSGATFGDYFLPAVLRSFSRQAPEVSVEVLITATGDLERNLLRGMAQFAFATHPAKHPRLKSIEVAEEKVMLICPPGHRLAKLKYVEPADLRGEIFLQYELGAGMTAILNELHKESGLILHPLRNSSNEAVKASVEDGIGLAVISEKAVAREVAHGHLRAIPIGKVPRRRQFHAWHLADAELPAAAMQLVRICQGLYPPGGKYVSNPRS